MHRKPEPRYTTYSFPKEDWVALLIVSVVTVLGVVLGYIFFRAVLR